jgi:hypothetical protein
MKHTAAISPPLVLQNHLKAVTLVMCVCGFLPVLTIVLNGLGIITLQHASLVIVLPAFLWSALMGAWFPATGRVAFTGWCAGIIAVTVYDASRIPFMLGGWPDFIPRIGNWLLDSDNAPAGVGYMWRYIGNGGGMGMAFFLFLSVIPPRRNLIRTCIVYGLFIFSCLMITLLLVPGAQDTMFRITLLSFSGSLTGHIVYGMMLGILYKLFMPVLKTQA